MPIDPRVAGLRGQLPPAAMQPPNPYMQGLQQPVPLQPPPQQPPQSGLGLQGQGPAINAGGPPLTAASAGLIGGAPQANEQFAQGERAGEMADVMRDEALEGARGKMIGNIYVPASIFEHGATAIKAYVAYKKEKEQKTERAAAKEELSALRAAYARQFGTAVDEESE